MDRIRIKDIAELCGLSVGTVDRVLHNRAGVAESSKKKVEEILNKLDYQPNRYASALASNKRYEFGCLILEHEKGEYWEKVEEGILNAVRNYSDFNIHINFFYYDPYDYSSFEKETKKVLNTRFDGILIAPTSPRYTKAFTDKLDLMGTPYIYIDSNVERTHPLAIFGQDSLKSGYFAGSIMKMLLCSSNQKEIVIIKITHKGLSGSNQQENRSEGFKKYFSIHAPQLKIYELELQPKGNELENTLILDRFFMEHPTVCNGVIFNSRSYIVGEYLQKKRKEKFNLMGYDLLDRNIECLKSGHITFLISQQPISQGFNAVKTLCDVLILKKEVSKVNLMPIDLLTKDNIEYYLMK